MKPADEMYELATKDKRRGAKKVLQAIDPMVQAAARDGCLSVTVPVDVSLASYDAFVEALYELRGLGYSASMKDVSDQRDGDYREFRIFWGNASAT